MRVTVRLFAILRERAGRDSIELELADGATVPTRSRRSASEPSWAKLLERMPVRMAVNRDYAEPETELSARATSWRWCHR